MKLNRIITLALFLMALQYLVISPSPNSFLLPEIGIVALVAISFSSKDVLIIISGLSLGYWAELIGSHPAKGSLMLSYALSALALFGLSRILDDGQTIHRFTKTVAALGVFHLVLLAFSGENFLSVWAGLLVVQIVSATFILSLNRRAQRFWQGA